MSEPKLIVAVKDHRYGVAGARYGAHFPVVCADDPPGKEVVSFDKYCSELIGNPYIGESWELESRVLGDPDDAYWLDYSNRRIIFHGSSDEHQFDHWDEWAVCHVEHPDLVVDWIVAFFRTYRDSRTLTADIVWDNWERDDLCFTDDTNRRRCGVAGDPLLVRGHVKPCSIKRLRVRSSPYQLLRADWRFAQPGLPP